VWNSIPDAVCCNQPISYLQEGDPFNVQVYAKNGRGYSTSTMTYSTTVEATPLENEINPPNLRMQGGTASVNVSWTHVDQTSTYRLEHAYYIGRDFTENYQWVSDTDSEPVCYYTCHKIGILLVTLLL
jgi:hypothetical protein